MTHSWLILNPTIATTRLIIPGWSILPGVFYRTFPNERLIILNPFMASQAVPEYVQKIGAHESYECVTSTVSELMGAMTVHGVLLFSMGCQWAMRHAPILRDFPCEAWSPVIDYDSAAVLQLQSRLTTSLTGTLTGFYRQIMPTTAMWTWWKTHELSCHLEYNHEAPLQDWLRRYTHSLDDWPPLWHVVRDPSDPIGDRSRMPTFFKHHDVTIDSNGHMGRLIPTTAPF